MTTVPSKLDTLGMREGGCVALRTYLYSESFVIQLRTPTGEEPASQWMGRIEHVATGAAAEFHSLEEMAAFCRRILSPGD